MSTSSYRFRDAKEDFAFAFIVYVMAVPSITIGSAMILGFLAGLGFEFSPIAIWPHILSGYGDVILAYTFANMQKLMFGTVVTPTAYVTYRMLKKQK